MSLISDALKKARQEAARQDAAQRGLPYAVGGAETAARRSLAGPLVAGLAAGLVLVGVLALAAYLGHWGPWRQGEGERLAGAAPAPPAAPAEAPAALSPSSAPPAGLTPVDPGAPPGPADPTAPNSPAPVQAAPSLQAPPPVARGGAAGEPSPAPPLARPAPPAASAGPPPVDRQPASAPPAIAQPRPAPELSPPAAPAPQPPAAARTAAPAVAGPAAADGSEERVYSGELPVPGGGTLRLSGVAFSENPVAVIDGKIVSRGEVVQGFTVVEIQRGRVRLQGHGMSVVVAVR